METTDVHIHLMVSHIPIFTIICGIIIFAYGLLKDNLSIRNAGLVFFVIAPIFCTILYFTGHGSIKVLKAMMPTMPMEPVEQHEELAEVALGSAWFLGVVALIALIIFRKKLQMKLRFALPILLIALFTAVVVGWTSNLGGKVRHIELRTEPGIR